MARMLRLAYHRKRLARKAQRLAQALLPTARAAVEEETKVFQRMQRSMLSSLAGPAGSSHVRDEARRRVMPEFLLAVGRDCESAEWRGRERELVELGRLMTVSAGDTGDHMQSLGQAACMLCVGRATMVLLVSVMLSY